MRYIDRRFLLPVAAATAWAQQPSPEAAKAEAALRSRVEQFFQLQVDKKYRQAEALVAEDSKDGYYNGNKYNIKTFVVDHIELTDGNTRAKVITKSDVNLIAPGAGAIKMTVPATSLWKLEKGEWVYYLEQEVKETPFGKLKTQTGGAPPRLEAERTKAPNLAALQHQVSADRDSVVLTAEAPRQSITISNDLPGGVDLDISGDYKEGFDVEIARKHLEKGEKTIVQFVAKPGKPGTSNLRIFVSPLSIELPVQVIRK